MKIYLVGRLTLDKYIDIIIPFKYGLNDLRKTITSIFDLDNTGFLKVICVCHSELDIFSLEKTYLRYENINFVTCKTDGIYPAMNLGIDLSKAEAVMFLGAGDCLEGSLETSSFKFDRINILFNSGIFSPSITLRTPRFSDKGDIYGLPKIPFHASIIYPRSIIGDLRYNENYKIISDRIFSARIHNLDEKNLNFEGSFWCNIMPDGVSSSSTFKAIHLHELLVFAFTQGLYIPALRILIAITVTAIRLRLL